MSLVRITPAFAVLAGLALTGPLPSRSAPQQDPVRVLATGGWSEPVADRTARTLRGRLSIAEGRVLADGRTRETAIYLELQNTTDAVGPPIEFPFDLNQNGLECQLWNPDGKLVPQGLTSGSTVVPPPSRVSIPFDSSTKLRVNFPGFGRPKENGFAIPLPNAFWLIPADAESDYFLSGTFKVRPAKPDQPWSWEGTLQLPKMRIPARARNVA